MPARNQPPVARTLRPKFLAKRSRTLGSASRFSGAEKPAKLKTPFRQKKWTSNPAATPQRKHDSARTASIVVPSAALYASSCGFSSAEAVMKAASQSSRMPCAENDAATGIVPYMHSGEAIPNRQAGTMPSRPSFCPRSRLKAPWILCLPKTATAEPISMPSSQ